MPKINWLTKASQETDFGILIQTFCLKSNG
jgi:hypothetical protein